MVRVEVWEEGVSLHLLVEVGVGGGWFGGS